MMGAALGFKVAPNSLPAKLASTAWSAEMAKAAVPQAVKGYQEAKQGNTYGAASDLTSAGLSSVFAAGGFMHASEGHPTGAPTELPKQPMPIKPEEAKTTQSTNAEPAQAAKVAPEHPPVATPAEIVKPQEASSSVAKSSTQAISTKPPIDVEMNFPPPKESAPAWQRAAANPELAVQFKRTGLSGFSIEAPYKFGLSEQGNINRTTGKVELNANATDPEHTIAHEVAHDIYDRLNPASKLKVEGYLRNNPDIEGSHAGGLEERIADHFADVLQGTAQVPADIHNAFFKSPLRDVVRQAAPEFTPPPIPPSAKTWSDIREKQFGYIQESDDLHAVVQADGDRMLVIKDVNGGRHSVPASVAADLLKNPRFSGNVSGVYLQSAEYATKMHAAEFDNHTSNYLPEMMRGVVEARPDLRQKVLDAAPGMQDRLPQAPNPSSAPSEPATIPSVPTRNPADLEPPMRKLASQIIRMKQLSAAAMNRLNVEYALRAISGQEIDDKGKMTGTDPNANPLADRKDTLETLSAARRNMVVAVADALGVGPKTLEQNNWRLTDEQVKQLQKAKSQGLRPYSLKEVGAADHPEAAFGDLVHYPLADINTANAKAAGVPDYKNLWDQLTDSQKKDRDAFKARGVTGSSEGLEGRTEIKAYGKDVETLRFEHDSLQSVLSRRIKEAQSKLTAAVPAWRDARVGATEPSKLAQDIAALGKGSRAGLPKELYAQEHLSPKTGEASTPSVVQKPLPTNEASEVSAPGETGGAKKPQDIRELVGENSPAVRWFDSVKELDARKAPDEEYRSILSTGSKNNLKKGETWRGKVLSYIKDEVGRHQATNPSASVLDKIQAIADDIQERHGAAAEGAIPQLFDAVNAKYKNPETANNVLHAALAKYQEHLELGHDEPMQRVLAELEKLPKEKGGQATTYANPLGPALQALFGKRKLAVGAEPLSGPLAIPESPISKIVDDLEQRKGPSNKEALTAFFANEGSKVAKTLADAPQFAKDTFAKVQDTLAASWQAYKNRPGLSPLEWALGWRRLSLSANAMVMHDFHNEILRNHPRADRREAMVNYLQASGGVMSDRDVNAQLELKANSFAPTSSENARLRKGYKAAQDLTPEEKATVAKYREYDKFLGQQEEKAGLELHRTENYIRQIWSEGSLARRGIDGIFSSSSFAVNAGWMKMRKYADYFEGEQDGLEAKNKDFAYLVSARARSSAEVLANQALIEHLYKEKMPDGSKLAEVQGTGNSQAPNPSSQDKQGAILIKGRAIPQAAVTPDGRTYVSINHPAFQNWKWVGEAESGEQILYKGNMLVHPDVAVQLKRILEPSAIRSNAVGKAALAASSIGKQTLLVGLFHPVQLGIHFLEHAAEGGTTSRTMSALNPFAKSVIDLDDKLQQHLVVHGLKVADFNAESMWDEGVMSRGFANGTPVVGGFFRALHDAMFQKYIPNLKMAMALDAVDRNVGRYHDRFKQEELNKLGRPATQADQASASLQAQSRIHRMTAEQMNAAFGGLNWDALPVNKTWQDVMRLTVLAPDFLLARAQFVGDALRPGGMESRKALLIGAAVQYTAARAFNAAMNDGDPKWDIHDWNKFIVGHNQYSLRTVQGDLMDSVLDPRKFVEHRLNPVTLRPLAEAVTGKDVFGHPASAGQQLFDFGKNVVPMPMQGLAESLGGKASGTLRDPKKGDDRIVDSLIQSLGLMRSKYRSPAERIVFNHFDNLKGGETDDALAMEQKNTFSRIRDDYREGKLKPEEITKALNDPNANLKQSEIRYLFRTKNETELVTRARFLPFGQVAEAFDKGTTIEKVQLTPLLQHKLLTLAPALRQPIEQRPNNFRRTLSAADNAKIRGQIQSEINWEKPPVVHPEVNNAVPASDR
jgi:hypothetical protein